MISIPNDHLPLYLKQLEKRGVHAANFAECIQWVRYFLDYCDKYPVPEAQSERVRLFIEKLKAKKQTDLQCRQAAYAVSVYLELQREKLSQEKAVEGESVVQGQRSCTELTPEEQPELRHRISQYSVAGYEEKSDSPQWDEGRTKQGQPLKREFVLRRPWFPL